MKRLHITLFILITVILSLVVNILFGGYLSAKLATLPLLRNLDLINPRAPIVINNRETVTVSDANDAVETAAGVRSKLSTLVYYEENQIVTVGSLLNWTADGYFVGSAKAFLVAGKTYAVVTNNGDIFPITKVYPDTASDLVMIETDVRGLPTVDTVEDREARPGQKVLFVSNSVGNNATTFLESYVRALAYDVSNVEFDSDKIMRGVSVQQVAPLVPGAAALNLSGRVMGIWSGTAVISSDAIRTFANNFFNESKVINRASFGFRYKQITPAEARALKLPEGALVTAVIASQAAAGAGLQVGDSIVAVNDRQLKDGLLLEALLETVRPGQSVSLTVDRAGTQLNIIVVTTAQK